jgi:hypothetical protein
MSKVGEDGKRGGGCVCVCVCVLCVSPSIFFEGEARAGRTLTALPKLAASLPKVGADDDGGDDGGHW